MIKQVAFIKDLVTYWIGEKVGQRPGRFYTVITPCFAMDDGYPCVRVKVIYYFTDGNRSEKIIDMPMTGLQMKWFRDWSKETYPSLYKSLDKRFNEAFEIIGRQVVLRYSFTNQYLEYYGKYKGYKL